MKKPEAIFKKWYEILEDATIEQTIFFESILEQFERKGMLTDRQIKKAEDIIAQIDELEFKDLNDFDLSDYIND